MNRHVAKTNIFGMPSVETATRIDNVDMVEAVHAAHYRLNARMRQLECHTRSHPRLEVGSIRYKRRPQLVDYSGARPVGPPRRRQRFKRRG